MSCTDAAAPVCLPCGSTHMGDTPGPRRNLAVATPRRAMCNLLEHRGLGDGALTETPKVSFIPAQGTRPGFMAPKTLWSAEGATHLLGPRIPLAYSLPFQPYLSSISTE